MHVQNVNWDLQNLVLYNRERSQAIEKKSIIGILTFFDPTTVSIHIRSRSKSFKNGRRIEKPLFPQNRIFFDRFRPFSIFVCDYMETGLKQEILLISVCSLNLWTFIGLFILQRDCVHFALTAKPVQTYMPRNEKSLQHYVWILVTSKPFEILIMVLISLNTIVLMMQVSEKSPVTRLFVRSSICPLI